VASVHQMQRGSRLDLVDAKQAKIEDYVIQKTLDGLFLMIAEQKKPFARILSASPPGWRKKYSDCSASNGHFGVPRPHLIQLKTGR